MRRWGQIGEAKPADWYASTITKIYRPDIWQLAAKELVAQGILTDGDIPQTDGSGTFATADFIDGTSYDGKDPIGYLNSFKIGNKDKIVQ